MIEVLRLNHRKKRDARMSTHVALISRALGASRISYSGERDSKMEKTLANVVSKWGGKFAIKHVANPKKLVSSRKRGGWKLAHLTMYGLPLAKKLRSLRSAGKLLLVVGGAKVPAWLYDEAHFNISISGQPHSEAGALAILLHELTKGRYPKFRGKLRIVPTKCGKKFVEKNIRKRG